MVGVEHTRFDGDAAGEVVGLREGEFTRTLLDDRAGLGRAEAEGRTEAHVVRADVHRGGGGIGDH